MKRQKSALFAFPLLATSIFTAQDAPLGIDNEPHYARIFSNQFCAVYTISLVAPILVLTARGQTLDKVLALKIGADDYLTKPFDGMELLARIEALLRCSTVTATGETYIFGSIQVNFRGTSVTRDGNIVPLSAREFELLCFFVQRPGMTLSREVLL